MWETVTDVKHSFTVKHGYKVFSIYTYFEIELPICTYIEIVFPLCTFWKCNIEFVYL